MKIKTGTQAVIILTFILFDLCFIQAQSMDSISYRKNAVYLEGLGNAGYGAYSLNYERNILKKNNGFVTARIGFARNYGNMFFSPILINKIYNKGGNHHFEFGGGISIAFFTSSRNKITALDYTYSGPTANLMYRYQKPDGKFIFRAGWTPVLYLNDINPLVTTLFFLLPGIGFGYMF